MKVGWFIPIWGWQWLVFENISSLYIILHKVSTHTHTSHIYILGYFLGTYLYTRLLFFFLAAPSTSTSCSAHNVCMHKHTISSIVCTLFCSFEMQGLLKGAVCYSDPLHFWSNSPNCSSCSSSCLFSVYSKTLVFIHSPGSVNGKQT